MPASRAVLALTALALALAPATAIAAPEWVAPASFSVPAGDTVAGQPTPEDQIAYQSGGVADEAFLQIESLSPLQTTLHIGTMPPGGGYSDQLTIDSSEGSYPLSPQIAVAPDGAAVAAWAELAGSNVKTSPFRYRAAYRPAGSATWEAPFTVAADTEHEEDFDIAPAIGGDGTAAVAVLHISGEKGAGGEGEPVDRIDVAVHPSAGDWSAPQRLSPDGESVGDLSLSVDANGDLTAAYARRFSEGATPSAEDDRYQVIVNRRPAVSGVWGPEEEITGKNFAGLVYAPHLGENEAGDGVLTYQYGEGKAFEVWGVTRQGPEGPWTAPAQLVSGGSSSSPEAAGVAPDGVAYILYTFQGNNSGEDCEGVVRAPVGGAFTAERCVSPTNEEVFSGSTAFLGDDALFAWRATQPGPGHSQEATIQGARWAAGAALPDVARNLDTAGLNYGTPTLVNDEQGTVVAFYSLGSQLRAAAFDGAPPILLGASVPAAATVGQPVSFSASFADLWSGLASGQPTWSFGDGSAPASGAAVSHTFTAPGTYPILLSASDALGNATSSTYTIAVGPTPTPIPTGKAVVPRLLVTLNSPSCPRKLSKKACRRRRSSPGAWRTLTGTASESAPSGGIAGVQVAVYRTQHGHFFSLLKGRFRRTSKTKAHNSFNAAAVHGGRWSLKLPKLEPGLYTILVRATDRAGHTATISRTVRVS